MKPEVSTSLPTAGFDGSAHAFDMLGPLLAVLAILFLAAWLLRRFALPSGLKTRALRVVAALPISTKERVLLVQVGERQVLVGVSAAGIQPLMTLDEPVCLDEAVDMEAQTSTNSFAATLRQFASRGER